VALLTVRWRVRHDRLDVVDEGMAYAPAIHRHNPNGKVYAVLGEFDGGRLRKILTHCPPLNPHAAISAAVHFAPQLIREGASGKRDAGTSPKLGMVDQRDVPLEITWCADG
jgi:hypothetical protein